VDAMLLKNVKPDNVLRHILYSYSRKQNKMEMFESRFGKVYSTTATMRALEASRSLSEQTSMQTSSPLAKTEALTVSPWTRISREINKLENDTVGESSRHLYDISVEFVGSSRRLQKLRKREWELVEDPLSVPKFETIQRRKEREEREKRLQELEQEYTAMWKAEEEMQAKKQESTTGKEKKAPTWLQFEKFLKSMEKKGYKTQDYLSLSDIRKGKLTDENEILEKFFKFIEEGKMDQGNRLLFQFKHGVNFAHMNYVIKRLCYCRRTERREKE
jgi:hypothetical protein